MGRNPGSYFYHHPIKSTSYFIAILFYFSLFILSVLKTCLGIFLFFKMNKTHQVFYCEESRKWKKIKQSSLHP